VILPSPEKPTGGKTAGATKPASRA
jgi:hypothetical protein